MGSSVTGTSTTAGARPGVTRLTFRTRSSSAVPTAAASVKPEVNRNRVPVGHDRQRRPHGQHWILLLPRRNRLAEVQRQIIRLRRLPDRPLVCPFCTLVARRKTGWKRSRRPGTTSDSVVAGPTGGDKRRFPTSCKALLRGSDERNRDLQAEALPTAIHATRGNLIGKVVITGSESRTPCPPQLVSLPQRSQARVLVCSVEEGLPGPHRVDFWNEPKIRNRVDPREGHPGVRIRFSSTQVRALLLAPSIQRFPLDIPPSRKQDDDRAQHRNGRKSSRSIRLDQFRGAVRIGLDGEHVGHAQRFGSQHDCRDFPWSVN